jgi:signal transduction histidine kinase
MPSKKPFKIIHTLAFRLTIWYAAIFAVSLLVAFALSYFLLKSTLHERMDQALLNETKEFSSILLLHGLEEFKTAILFEAEADGVDKVFYRLISRDGAEIGSSNLSSWDFVSYEPALKISNSGADHFFETIQIPDTPFKARILYSITDKDKVIQAGESMSYDEEFLETFRNIFGITIILMIIFAGIFGWFMARRALMGVEEVTQTAINISCGEFSSRVPIAERGEEIERLATTFNNMLEYIQGLIKGIKEVTDNIAHDLRSPLARIRGIAETALMTPGFVSDYESVIGNFIEECDRLIGIINTMLEISEAEAGVSKLEIAEINISKLVRDACVLFQLIAEDKHICLIQKIGTDLSIFADQQKMQRVTANLLDNALKYTKPGGTITISSEQNEHEVIISFIDDGIGISEKDLPHIFKRFYRCDRSRSQPGIGLGLSLAQAIVKAHGGDIYVTSLPDNGSTFALTLPYKH